MPLDSRIHRNQSRRPADLTAVGGVSPGPQSRHPRIFKGIREVMAERAAVWREMVYSMSRDWGPRRGGVGGW